MIKSEYSFNDLKFSSQIIRDLIDESAGLEPFISSFFKLENIKNQISKKAFSDQKRDLLIAALNSQNRGFQLSDKTQLNINSIKKSTTFTITTGHQLNLLTGPLYSIYKVAQVISICDKLNAGYPEHHFVPVFWMATEDHDFEEINHIHLFGKKIEWQKDDQQEKIVGRINTAKIEPFLNQISEKFQDPDAQIILNKFLSIYEDTGSLVEATRALMNSLFGEYGLVILDGDDVNLKASFQSVFIKEIEDTITFKNVSATNIALEKAIYHQQVYVRECNLFYIDKNGVRHRIKKESDQFEINSSQFSTDELINKIKENPADFSPNALLRPVYQESILPNLAYVGGGGEIAYWMQLKGVFDTLDVTFPLLKVRDSVLILNTKQKQLLEENNINLLDLKLGVSQLIKDLAIEEANPAIDLSHPRKLIEQAQTEISEKAVTINQGLINMIEAEFSKFGNSIERIEQKLIKAEKGKFEQLENKLNKLSEQIYPDGGFQERYENFIPFIIKYPTFIQDIVGALKGDEPTKIRIIIKD